MGELADELMQLRRGRGVLAPEIAGRIGPRLRERAGVAESDQPRQVRARVQGCLSELAEGLPGDLRLAFRVGLGLHSDAQFRFFEERMAWLGDEIQRDARTARRRFDEAVRMVDAAAGTAVAGARRTVSAAAMGNALTVPEVGTQVLDYQVETWYQMLTAPPESGTRIGYVTGDIRRVRSAQIWVNPENTQMLMSRPEEQTVSAAIRYTGARHDAAGRIAEDLIADELAAATAGTVEFAAGTAICTGAGELARSNNVRMLVHVAAVRGEPGQGYRQVTDVGRCLANALREAERFCAQEAGADTVLVPLLGAGTGRADAQSTLHALLGVALSHLSAGRGSLRGVLFLAYDMRDLAACHAVLDASPFLASVNV